jgi:hypothetical protein
MDGVHVQAATGSVAGVSWLKRILPSNKPERARAPPCRGARNASCIRCQRGMSRVAARRGSSGDTVACVSVSCVQKGKRNSNSNSSKRNSGSSSSRRRRSQLGVMMFATTLVALASRWGAPKGAGGVGSAVVPAAQGSSVMAVVVPSLDDPSMVLKATWGDVLDHMNTRLSWEDPELTLDVVDMSGGDRGGDSGGGGGVVDKLASADVVYAMNVRDEGQVEALLQALATASPASFVALNSSELLEAKNTVHRGGSRASGFLSFLAPLFGSTLGDRRASDGVLSTMKELFYRQSSDDLLYSFLVLFNAASKPVRSVINSTKRSDAGLKEAMCMVKNCGKEILECVTDETCNKGLSCLNTCAFNDQVCSYLCIASYESNAFQQFSLCILQKHNCLGLSAEIPQNPRPQPMSTFRGAPMTHELAEKLFYGWLDEETFSWRVFAGMNAAFDRFPCQYQLFFPGKAKGSFWYRPIFKVQTLEGTEVWRERLYRVRRQPPAYRDDGLPVFRLSVLDNGVTSLEDWTVLSCDEEHLEWCVFSYSGAAGKAGMAYSGAILASRDGSWPTDDASITTIKESLERSGIKMWELFSVDNSQCADFDPSITTLKIP